MKNANISTHVKCIIRICLLCATVLFGTMPVFAQEYATITGKLIDKSNNESILYANIGLFGTSDSKLKYGIMSDTSGCFVISNVHTGNYILKATMLGYEPVIMEINIPGNTRYNAGTLLMNKNAIKLGETVIVADKLKGKSEKEKTSYFITQKMSQASNNGLDIIKLIPGVQVDLMRNISLDGSQRILVLVDGKERDKNFLSQIIPDHIEKVEILNTPPAGYDGDVTGVINIVLKKEKKSGISGQINLEIPVWSTLYYIHPDYSMNFTYKNLNFFTSYNGEMIHFDQQESIFRRIQKNGVFYETHSDQYVVQKLWSHYFHYGVDYTLSSKSQIIFYGFFNPYSQEYDGQAKAITQMNNKGEWQASRTTNDMNRSTFLSLFFKHSFNERGGEFTMDMSNYMLKGENTATYNPNSDVATEIVNSSKPIQKAVNLKADVNIPLGYNLLLSSGARMRSYTMQDGILNNFNYSGKIYSTYATVGQALSNFDWKLGLRVEKSVYDLQQVFRKQYVNLLPSVSLGYKISADKTIKFAVSNTVNRPNIYQLNPNVSIDDPYTVRKGNPSLNPELRTAMSLEYSQKFKSNFSSVRLFYNRIGNAINNLSFLNDTSAFEFQTANLGTLHQSGIQFSGTFKLGRLITFIPYLRLYGQFTEVNQLAEQFLIQNRKQMVVEPGFSSLISFKYDINVGMNFQYSSPRNNISGNSFSDPLYMISIDKTFKNRIKAGIVGIIPFKDTFTYQGSEIDYQNFYSRYAGVIKLSKPLLWLKLSYQFSSGKKREAISRGFDDIDAVPKKGGF